MKCIECQNAQMQSSTDHVKQGFVLCGAEKIGHDFKGLTFERDCKLFKKAGDETIIKRVNWFDGIKTGFKSEAINGDRVYRQKMEMKRRK